MRLSATDGFSGFIAAPAIVAVRRSHPDVSLEIVAATGRAAQQRVGVDLEVVVGSPHVNRAEAMHLADYALGLYASRDVPRAARHARTTGRPRRPRRSSTSSSRCCRSTRSTRRDGRPATWSTRCRAPTCYVHVDATRAGAGFGLLPAFLADRHDDLVRLFPDEIDERLPYWLVCRPEALRQPAVLAFIDALHARIADVAGRPARQRRGRPHR